jgi:hypothetical protein
MNMNNESRHRLAPAELAEIILDVEGAMPQANRPNKWPEFKHVDGQMLQTILRITSPEAASGPIAE